MSAIVSLVPAGGICSPRLTLQEMSPRVVKLFSGLVVGLSSERVIFDVSHQTFGHVFDGFRGRSYNTVQSSWKFRL